MDLKTILAKAPSALTEAEKAFIKTHEAELSTEEKATFAEAISEMDGIDMKALEAMFDKSAGDAATKAAEKVAEVLVSKFLDGVDTARAKAIDTGVKEPAKDANDKTRKFMKALLLGDRAAMKALTTETSGSSPDDAQAGLLIPSELTREVLRIAETQFGIVRRDALYLPFSGPGNSRQIPSLGTSVSVFWTDEGEAKTSTQPKFNVVTQTLKKLAAIVPMTEEILEDSAIDLNSLLGTLFAEAIAKEEDAQFFAGTGSPWTGILNNNDVNKVDAAGDASQLTADDLLAMIDATPTGALNGARFYLSRSALSRIRLLKDTQGNYIYQAPGATLPGTIWDYPYTTSDSFPAISGVSEDDPFVLFGNLKQGVVFGDKQQLRVKLLDQATITDTDGETTINLAEQDMVALRVVERVGFVVALPKALTVLFANATESA